MGPDFKTLLLAQRVSIHWRDVIKGAPTLQKKLFLLPVASHQEAVALGMVGSHDWVRILSRLDFRAGHPVLLNPLVLEPRPGTHYGKEFYIRFTANVQRNAKGSSRRRFVSSCERMLFTQPPSTPLTVTTYPRIRRLYRPLLGTVARDLDPDSNTVSVRDLVVEMDQALAHESRSWRADIPRTELYWRSPMTTYHECTVLFV